MMLSPTRISDEEDAAIEPEMVRLRLQLGARTLATVGRRLARIALPLGDAISGRVPALPPLGARADGYALFSLRADRLPTMRRAGGGMIAFVRQRYPRHYIDLALSPAAYRARLSASARAGLNRKTRRLAAASGGKIDLRCYQTPGELEQFHAQARALAERTYQERHFGGGLPGDAGFVSAMLARSAMGGARGWLLWKDEAPIAYLYSTIDAGIVRYDFVGHDPDFAALSPGIVLQGAVIDTLLGAPGLTHFDFTEGDGQHKRQFATDSVACLDLLLLRPGIANTLAVATISGFDRAAAMGKAVARRLGLERAARRLRR